MDYTATYIGNSGFVLRMGERAYVFDYQGDGHEAVSAALSGAREALFLASHRHSDHYCTDIFSFAAPGLRCEYLLSSDICAPRHAGVRMISEGETLSMCGADITAFGSTDEGVSFLLSVGGARVFHAGDLNWWHWRDESTSEEVACELERFERVLAMLPAGIDIAFFPCDPRLGTGYADGADMFLERVRPAVFFPMHFREAFYAPADFARRHSGGITRVAALTRQGESFSGRI